MSFRGKRVLSLESRRAQETAELIRRNGGEPFVAPSVREVPIEANAAALNFAEDLFAGQFDMMILLTGVGTRQLAKVIASKHSPERLSDALGRITIVARGPKPAAALRELGVPVTILVGEPSTWREILSALENRPERRIAVQEYGKPATELVEGLRARGAEVRTIPVYAYELPEDVEPLREAVTRLVSDAFEVTLFTTSQQLIHLLDIARQMDLEERTMEGIRKSVVASIGPTTSETLREHGIEPDIEASHPKLGLLVKEAAEHAHDMLWNKKS
jgi:uroporphyrinogen-III synthase